MGNTNKGFTLLEVMIAVAIVAILASIAVPNYRTYVTRGRIPQATAALADARVKMEQYFQDNRAYPTGCSATPGATEIAVVPTQDFTFACNIVGQTYTVTATANAGGPMDGFAYTINETGARTSVITGQAA